MVSIDGEGFAKIPDFVSVTNLERMPAVVDILHHFRSFQIGPNQWRVDAPVKFSQNIATLAINLPDHRLRRKIKILDRRTFAQKLRVMADSEISSGFFP